MFEVPIVVFVLATISRAPGIDLASRSTARAARPHLREAAKHAVLSPCGARESWTKEEDVCVTCERTVPLWS